MKFSRAMVAWMAASMAFVPHAVMADEPKVGSVSPPGRGTFFTGLGFAIGGAVVGSVGTGLAFYGCHPDGSPVACGFGIPMATGGAGFVLNGVLFMILGKIVEGRASHAAWVPTNVAFSSREVTLGWQF